MSFKVGDRIKVINTTSSSRFPNGTTGTITKVAEEYLSIDLFCKDTNEITPVVWFKFRVTKVGSNYKERRTNVSR